MVKEKKSGLTRIVKKTLKLSLIIFPILILFIGSFFIGSYIYFENNFRDKIYPGVKIDQIDFRNKSKNEVNEFFREKSLPFKNLKIELSFEDKISTLSAEELSIQYDSTLSAEQAYSIGRTNQILTDTYLKWRAMTVGIDLMSVLKINKEIIDEKLDDLAVAIDIAPQDALFDFENGKVKVFKPSKSGRELNKQKSRQSILSSIYSFSKQPDISSPVINLSLPVDELKPAITTENSNKFGIKELLGTGTSRFHGSIASRIHNVNLAASRIHGHLIPPGAVFSFNDALGDVSAATGFQPAYIIKEGRTVLGDGGGVCQVSTTLFRSALNTGLPIVERHAHAYRVHYYEEESPVGIDATVFAPTYDLKIKNDTENYLLIQTRIDTTNYFLAFDIYGTKDGRAVTLTKPVLYGQSPPPPDLYQDDPTLPKGIVKQVDWSAWGGKTNFDYQVEKNNEILTKQSFFSNFRPWQAVFLRGTKE